MQTGAAVVAYDGSPLKPMGVLWDLVEKLKSVVHLEIVKLPALKSDNSLG